ncbi:MAG TPA: A/G-specific adenine glycosylase [Parvularcula sp.]|nr:A/G-specific adenine glycosylase [Parvularcula sp.]
MSAIPKVLLRWYDRHARTLPWRAPPKSQARADPYRVWLSEVMLQQTTVATVRPRYEAFLARWPSVDALADAPLDDVLSEWAGLGYYARARNLHKCAVEVAALRRFPDTEEGLRALPGVGDYTAAAIAAIAFDRRAVVMDGNVERVAARLFAIATPLPKAKPELKAAMSALWPVKRSGDFAQALMDLGAGVCTPRAPNCLLCPLSEHCEARATGVAETLPVKAMKAAKPLRRGVAYALVNERGEILFERRPEKGLLGGMLGLPGAAWVEASTPEHRHPGAGAAGTRGPSPAPAIRGAGGSGDRSRARDFVAPRDDGGACVFGVGDWRPAGTVTHTFTHFQLELDVMTARTPKGFRAGPGQQWIAPEKARLPTVMRKAVERAVAFTAHPGEGPEPAQAGLREKKAAARAARSRFRPSPG